MCRYILTATLLLFSFTYPSVASENMHSTQMTSAGSDLFEKSRHEMHKAMDVKPTGNTDADFVLNMIPHHEGAVAMAKVELEHGKDPELRKLAEDIIRAQDKEIKLMKEWLAKNHVRKN